MLRNDVYAAITREREYQERRWGTVGEPSRTVAEWLLILCSELHEAEEAWVGGGDDDALCEILQVAAVAVACMEQHGAVERGACARARDDAARQRGLAELAASTREKEDG